MSIIKDVKSRQVFDSRGFPTVETEIVLNNGCKDFAIVPSGASTGTYEAHELRDKNKSYLNKGVLNAVSNVNKFIKKELLGLSVLNQKKIDHLLLDIDKTENKKKLGANAILSVSIAVAKTASRLKNIPLYKYLSSQKKYYLPYPMLNNHSI